MEKKDKKVVTTSARCVSTNGDREVYWKHAIEVTAATDEWFHVCAESVVREGRPPASSPINLIVNPMRQGNIYTKPGNFSHGDLHACIEALQDVINWGNSEASRSFGDAGGCDE
jgi:hypothetical protein